MGGDTVSELEQRMTSTEFPFFSLAQMSLKASGGKRMWLVCHMLTLRGIHLGVSNGDIILWLRSVATAWDNSLGENTTRLEFENMIRLLPLSISAGSGNVQIKFAKYTYKFYRVHVTLAC